MLPCLAIQCSAPHAPSIVWMSLPQTVAAVTRTSTSPAASSPADTGKGTDTKRIGSPALVNTHARAVLAPLSLPPRPVLHGAAAAPASAPAGAPSGGCVHAAMTDGSGGASDAAASREAPDDAMAARELDERTRDVVDARFRELRLIAVWPHPFITKITS